MKLKAHELRLKTSKELLHELDEQKAEFLNLRVAKVTGAAPSKLMKIRVVRKNIARILTFYNVRRHEAARAEWDGKSRIPKQLRPKLTRKLRTRPTKAQLTAIPAKKKKFARAWPKRLYALSAEPLNK